jgi:hypothetical protein
MFLVLQNHEFLGLVSKILMVILVLQNIIVSKNSPYFKKNYKKWILLVL